MRPSPMMWRKVFFNFIDWMKLKNTLRHILGEGLITHLGLDYYGE